MAGDFFDDYVLSQITEGMDAADRIVSVKRDWSDCPRERQVIKTISIVEE